MAYPSVSFMMTSPTIGFQPIGATSTTQNHPLGTIIKAADGTLGEGEFIYLKGVASTAAGDTVIYDQKAATTTRTVHSSAARGEIAVAMSANVASQYGWYCISGVVPVNSGSNTVAAGAKVYLTSTAAQIDDAVVATDGVDGAVTESANSGGFTYCLLQRPSATGNG